MPSANASQQTYSLIGRQRGVYHGRLLLLELNSHLSAIFAESYRPTTNLDDTALDAVLDDQLDGLDRTVLTETMDTIHSLCAGGQICTIRRLE